MRHAGVPGCVRRLAQCSRCRGCRPGSDTAFLPSLCPASDPSRFRAWLVRIAFRLALDHERSARRREHRETAWANGQPKATAEDIASSNEFGRRLQQAMAALSEKSRLVLVLTSIDGHSLEEVAELLQLPVGTVKSRLHSARKQLAEKLR